MNSFIFSFGAAFLVSLISLIGIIFVIFRLKNLDRITLLIVAFAVGSLLGDAFIHLLPETFNTIASPLSSLLIIFGILLFFSFEKILRWHHCHDPDCDPHESHHVVAVNLLGDTVHNFIDGMLIAASFIVSPALGFSTTFAVMIHEIPQEIGHMGVFLHHGLSIKTSLRYNFISALSAIAGVLATFLIGSSVKDFSNYLIPVTAGGFIYLAATDLIPELHSQNDKLNFSFYQLVAIIIGVVLMLSLLLFE